jgi:type I restriction enzyme M protein
MTKKKSTVVQDEATPWDGEESPKPGFVRDYISGIPVKSSPEEIEAVQVFAQRLVEDYGYPKSHLQTRPQYRVRKRPSDEAKAYPVDIAVFKGTGRVEDDLSCRRVQKEKPQRRRFAAQALS